MGEIESESARKISGHSMRVRRAQDIVNSETSLPVVISMRR